MVYSFDSRIAELYGVDEAVFIHNLYYWLMKNEANGRHYYDGKSWTYNSLQAFAKLFPFWSKRQVERIINNLKAKGAIHVGNYNPAGFDRTQWYALDETVYCIYANGDTHFTEWGRPFPQTVTPIPDSKPNSKPDIINTDDVQMVVDDFLSICKSMPTIRDVSPSRKKAIKSAIAHAGGIDALRDAFKKAEASDFLTGRNGGWGGCGFDWILKPANLSKILEGNYDNRAGRKKTATSIDDSSLDLDEYEKAVQDFVPIFREKDET